MPGPVNLARIPRLVLRGLHAGADGLLDLLFPPVCALCHADLAASPQNAQLCATCRAALACEPAPLCRRCAAPVGPYINTAKGCLKCRGRTFHFDRVLALGGYEALRRQACLRLKRPACEALATALAELLWDAHAAVLEAEQPAAVIPIPDHWRRRATRRAEPLETLAARLAARLNRRCRRPILKRVRRTLPQASLAPSRRYRNVRGAFRARRLSALQGATVVLVDDVLTTGATASEAARALKNAGVARVVAVVVARGVGLK